VHITSTTVRVVQEDILLAVLVEVHQPCGFPVVGHGDHHILRPPGEHVRPRHAEIDSEEIVRVKPKVRQ